MTSSNQENPLSRWSRRKQQTLTETQQEDQLINCQQQNLSSADSDIAALSDVNGEPEEAVVVLTDEDMLPVDSLHEGSDFSGFMSSGVSDELRNLALRKLFKAPSFNIRDGLDEYDEDYTSFEKLGDIVTCDMKHQIEMEAKKKLEKEAEKLKEDEAQHATESSEIPQKDAQPDSPQDSEQDLGQDQPPHDLDASHQTPQIDVDVSEQPFTETAETPSQSTAQQHE